MTCPDFIVDADGVLARGEKTFIRPMRLEDIAERHRWPPFDDWHLSHLNPRNLEPGEAAAIYERRRGLRDWRWYTILDQDEIMVGELALRELDETRRSARLGIHLRSDRLGQGYGTDALLAFLHYYFLRLRFAVLHLDVAESNIRAIRVYERCGFRVAGRFDRLDRSGRDVFSDPDLREEQRYFRKRQGRIYARFLEMRLTRAAFLGIEPAR